MPIEITMPRLSDTMEEGTLVAWKVKVGDSVKSGDQLADIETDKATMQLEAFDDGVVAALVAKPGQPVKVGGLILILAAKGESVDAAAAAAAAAGSTAAPASKAAASDPKAAKSAVTSDARPAAPAGKVRISPLARKLADEHGVDPAALKGSGPDGRIIKRDVLQAAGAAPAPAPAPAHAAPAKPIGPAPVTPAAKPAPIKAPVAPPAQLESKTVPVTSMRKTIARRLLESKTTIPHFTVNMTVNMDPVLSMRTTLNQFMLDQQVKISVNDFVVRACALALARHPGVNASWSDQGILMHGTVNVGVAVALPEDKGGGLVVPVIRDAHLRELKTISAEIRSLAEKARTKGLSVEDMADGTFTISNLGMFGVEHFEAIINPPQGAILAVGAALEKPVVRDGKIVVGHEMSITLSADHRCIDGAMAAQFLQTIKKMLENPAVLLV